MKLRIIVAAMAMCGSLTACNYSATGEITGKTVNGPTGQTDEMGFKFGVTISSGKMHALTSGGGLDVSNIAIDITGNGTAVLDSSGTGTLLVKQGGTVIGSTSFDYVVLDSMAVVANPTLVNAWLANFPSADGYDVELAAIQTVDVAQGIATLTADAYYGGTEITTASASWTSSAGGGCNNPGGGDGGYFPEQPIELPGEGGPCP